MNARSYDEADIIHKTEFEKVKKLIDSKIKKIEDNKNTDYKIHGRYNDTITI